ncbi:hypothetical protein BOTBODRAFT_27919 [Botryobasidium botryosum FD-172 SS1]|uniref:Uncharacterized protein n=1 Tax=Botryobasidium botryosum (strain FD-172 SS1) TaxID=930990 RepID=A0A067MXE5_BOTB1|nr:hypothetical protein BOTBODRAFT_27919 [Botryobasidium botryosum FD-172 SS1]
MIPPTHPNRLVVHRLLFHYLASAGARTLARTVWEEVRQAGHKPTTRESLLLLDIKIGRLKRKRVSPSAVKALMRKEPKAGVQRLYSLALRLLARGGQSYGVNKFTRRFSPRTSSAFNTLLHSRLASSRSKRNARQVKAVFAKLNALISEKFIPDRVTVNVLLKCLLRWPAVTSSTKLRLLFDQLVSSGYPGVVPGETAPFGTQWEATPSQLGLLRPMLTGEVSFRRHAKPMYLMFIKAFYLRGDRSAAKKVIGILKAAELEEKERDVAEAAARRRTRTQGRAGGSLGVLPSDIEC